MTSLALILALFLQVNRDREKDPSWEFAAGLEDIGFYEEALKAYREAAKGPPGQALCGNAIAGNEVRSQMAQARCLERLNRHGEAIALYFQAAENMLCLFECGAARRIVDLYDAAGRLDSLKKELDRRDAEFEERMKRSPLGPSDDQVRRWRPSLPVRRLMELRQAEKGGRWGDLIRFFLESKIPQVSLEAANADSLLEAARLLGRHSESTVPLLTEKFEAASAEARSWIAYTLGLCGTPEAVAFLKEALADRKNSGFRNVTLFALDLCGEAGRRVLTELRPSADVYLQKAIDGVFEKARPLKASPALLTPISKDLKLP